LNSKGPVKTIVIKENASGIASVGVRHMVDPPEKGLSKAELSLMKLVFPHIYGEHEECKICGVSKGAYESTYPLSQLTKVGKGYYCSEHVAQYRVPAFHSIEIRRRRHGEEIVLDHLTAYGSLKACSIRYSSAGYFGHPSIRPVQHRGRRWQLE
jgi:hypothetical protein